MKTFFFCVSTILSTLSVLASSPGDSIGWTQFDIQYQGSSGSRIALDSSGGVHVVYVRAESLYLSGQPYYNYRNPAGQWLNPLYSGGSYWDPSVQLSLTPDNRVATAFDRKWPIAAFESVYCNIQVTPGSDQFITRRPPFHFGSIYVVYPFIAADRSGRIHLIETENPDYPVGHLPPWQFGYTNSSNNGVSWRSIVCVDTIMTPSAIIVSSSVSNKVAIVYSHPIDTLYQLKNDIYYIQSSDGTTWDFAGGKVDLTNYAQGSDSLYSYSDCAAIYDYNDNLHIVWNAHRAVGNTYFDVSYLYHYDLASGTINTITVSGDSWPRQRCAWGAWDWQICKMSLGIHPPTGGLFVIYTRFDSTDCSQGGYANGDLYMQYSLDGGQQWSSGVNMTNSHTPNCAPGECDSDNWSSLASVVDDYLHILYLDDKDAGAAVWPFPQGQITRNPILYLEYPNPITSVHESEPIPNDFSLSQNYPNPFNAQTKIRYYLKHDSNVNLSIYNIMGGLIATLNQGIVFAGPHDVIWEARYCATGTYFCVLRTTEGSRQIKMLYIK